MSIPHLIIRQKGSRLIMLEETFISVCEGNIPAAIIMRIFENWQEFKIKERKQKRQENRARRKEGMDTLELDDWFYLSYEMLKKESLGLLKEHEVRSGLTYLLSRGFAQKRHNPKYRWDRTMQYRLDIDAVNEAIAALSPLIDEDEDDDSEDAPDSSPATNGSSPVTDGREPGTGLSGTPHRDDRDAAPQLYQRNLTQKSSQKSSHAARRSDFSSKSQNQEEDKNRNCQTEGLSPQAIEDKKKDPPFKHSSKSDQEQLVEKLTCLYSVYPDQKRELLEWAQEYLALQTPPELVYNALDKLSMREALDYPIAWLHGVIKKLRFEHEHVSRVHERLRKDTRKDKANREQWERERMPVRIGPTISSLMAMMKTGERRFDEETGEQIV